MEAIGDDPRYPRKSYTPIPYGSSNPQKQKTRTRDTPFTRPIPNFNDDDEMDEFNEEIDHKNGNINGSSRNFDEEEDFLKYPKKRKMKNLVSAYEFAPWVKQSESGRTTSRADEDDWTEHGMFVLLEVWGNRFLQLGRKSLRSEDWEEVAEKVSETSKIERKESQCRNMLESLKKKYKKEKLKMEQMGLKSSKWGFFKKIDMLMASSPRQDYGLACGVDSGEFVFMNTRVYLDRSDGFDEMKDSPMESEASEEETEDGNGGRDWDKGSSSSSSFRVLTDSIHKFDEIYGKIESSKRHQMMELEKMRKDFSKELELQKKQIMERTEAEIAKIREEEDDDDDDDDDDEDDDDDDDDEEEDEVEVEVEVEEDTSASAVDLSE
ncbi:trihelix transcription factor ENAP1 [Humulus lupulus]|uniref:trihelix transcription factor ENAP1 n=1 Tax=Humulus lupulus TaxID=3486 RepID=UPI002B400966|nr:trihelix transcription factor ENAP1 [Humulus lupulus]